MANNIDRKYALSDHVPFSFLLKIPSKLQFIIEQEKAKHDCSLRRLVNEYDAEDSFFYRAFNKTCRMLDCDAIVLFHPIRTLSLLFIVFRGIREMNAEEFKIIRERVLMV